MNTIKACALSALMTVSASAEALTNDLNQGDWIVGFSGSYSHLSASEGGDSLSANILYFAVDANYFLTDEISLGASTFGIYLPSTGDVDDGFAAGIEPNIRYNFQNSSNYLPYVGLHGGVALGEIGGENDSIYTYGVHAGVLFPIADSAYFDIKIKYTEFDLPSGSDLNLDTTQVLFGFLIKF